MKILAVLSLSVLLAACNSEEYFPTEEFVMGNDGYCSEAKDLSSCHSLGDRCQAAFLDLEKDDQEPIFAACIANPNYTDPSAPTDPVVADPSAPTDPVATDPSAPTDPVATDPSAPTDPVATDPSAPTDPVVTDPSAPTDPVITDPAAPVPPTLNDAWKSKCQNLDPKYLYVKKLVSKKKTETLVKVKVCHNTDRNEHTILIPCQALKGHAQHHDGSDYLGACLQ